MLIALFVAFAAAAPVSEALLTAAPHLPTGTKPADICQHEPTLPDAFAAPVTLIGVKRPAGGCALAGALVRGAWVATEDAAAAALDPAVWASADANTRAGLLSRWATDALLAFDQPLTAPTLQGADADGNLTLTGLSWRAFADEPGAWRAYQGSLRFSATGALLGREQSATTHQIARLALKELASNGVSAERVFEVLSANAGPLNRCVRTRQAERLDLEDVTKLRWTLTAGKPSGFTAGESDDQLARCYATVLTNTKFPPELTGSVTFGFVVKQHKLP